MWELLKQLNERGRTIILTTHYLEEAEYLCKHVGIINKGKIIVDEPMRDLLEQLKRTTLIVYLKEPLTTPPELSTAESIMTDNKTLELTFEGEVTLDLVFNELYNKNISVLSVRNKANRLEELFMDLVKG